MMFQRAIIHPQALKQDLKARLIHLVDEDAQAFDAILAANRLPDKTSEQKDYKEKFNKNTMMS